MNANAKATRATEIGIDRGKVAADIAALESQIGALETRDQELWRELCALFDGKPAKTVTETVATEPAPDKATKPTKERKPRTPKADKAPETTGGVYANVGSLDDIKASILMLMRDDPDGWFGVTDLAKSIGCDSKLVSKAIVKLSVEDNGGNKRAKKYRLKETLDVSDDSEPLETETDNNLDDTKEAAE
jgi:hypothetical protein